jgi:hypothetical protein
MPESDDSRNPIAGKSRWHSFRGTENGVWDDVTGSVRAALVRYAYQASSAPEMMASVSARPKYSGCVMVDKTKGQADRDTFDGSPLTFDVGRNI